MTKYKTYFNWSSGKDSALALYYLLQNKNYTVKQLFTTVNSYNDRVSMHGLRKELLIAQTKAIGISSKIIELPQEPTMVAYEDIMHKVTAGLKDQKFTHSAFGDIFLEDLRQYRDQQLAKQNIKTIYPLWKRDTKQLINEFLSLKFKSIVVSANGKYFDSSFVGTIIDEDFINNLPRDVDPCGENGEFHTFCFDGPIFNNPIDFKIGEKVFHEYTTPKTENSENNSEKTGFWYCDLLP